MENQNNIPAWARSWYIAKLDANTIYIACLLKEIVEVI